MQGQPDDSSREPGRSAWPLIALSTQKALWCRAVWDGHSGGPNRGVIDSAGVSGSGALIMVGFDVVSEGGMTELALESVETHHSIPTTA